MSRPTTSQESRTDQHERRFRPYPHYKSSKLNWVAKIPESWSAPRLGFVTEVNPPKGSIRDEPNDYPVSFVPMESIGEQGGLDLSTEKPLSEVVDGYTYFEDGDVLVAKITPCFENGKGALPRNLTSGTGFGTTELHVLQPGDDIDKRFLFYLTISDHFRKLGEASMYGAAGQKRVPEEFVFGFRHPLPPLPEQRGIANFLDRSTSRIDRLIDKKERLIELLEERRTALITKAVTKGLDPDAPMKDSGVEWLGEIPKHWEVPELRYISDPNRPIMYGIVLPGPSVEDGVPIIKGGDVSRGNLDADGLNRTTREIDGDNASSRVQTGDVVYSIRGSFGDVAVVPPELDGANLTQDTARISPREDVSTSWLKFMLSSAPIAAQADANALGAAVKGINIRELKRLRVPLPPREDQKAISDYLAQKTQRISDTVSAIRRAMNLLQEYRSALITAAVTGKIDVRDQAA